MYADLLRAVSHDIRTPLTGIVGATNVLLEQDGGLTQEQRQQLLRSTNEDAQWLIRIVENLLSITRISSEEAKVKKEPEPRRRSSSPPWPRPTSTTRRWISVSICRLS